MNIIALGGVNLDILGQSDGVFVSAIPIPDASVSAPEGSYTTSPRNWSASGTACRLSHASGMTTPP